MFGGLLQILTVFHLRGIEIIENRFIDASVFTALLVSLWPFDPFHDSYV
jgi:hypothetical protein